MQPELVIREFVPDDAEFCFRLRSTAFIMRFYDEIGPEAVAACVNAYMPEDYVRMATEMMFFIVESQGEPVGFFTVKRLDERTAEIPLIYIDLDHIGEGIGTQCLRFIENWLASHWQNVAELIVDTIIPKYNSGFYEKAGFVARGEVLCEFGARGITGLRLCKELTL
jgi:GNAT superfamily N-acetyltransferase